MNVETSGSMKRRLTYYSTDRLAVQSHDGLPQLLMSGAQQRSFTNAGEGVNLDS